MKLSKHNNGMYYREWTYDRHTIADATRSYAYNLIDRDDTVMDIGLNIGTFTFFASLIAERVISYEPELENYRIAELNMMERSNVELINSAVVTGEEKTMRLYMNDGHPGGYSLHKPGRAHSVEVSCVNFEEEVDKYKPQVIKIDCEGEEINLLRVAMPDHVRVLMFEYHFFRKYFRDHFPKIIKILKEQSFTEYADRPIRVTPKARTTIVHLIRR